MFFDCEEQGFMLKYLGLPIRGGKLEGKSGIQTFIDFRETHMEMKISTRWWWGVVEFMQFQMSPR